MAVINLTLGLGNERLALPVHVKQTSLGEVHVDHYWLDVRTLYGQRNRPATTHSAVLAVYRYMCEREHEFFSTATTETYLLAALLPAVRPNGSRRVFADARLPGSSTKEREDQTGELEEVLCTCSALSISRQQFYDTSLSLLGRPEFTENEQLAYLELTTQLFRGTYRLYRGEHDAALARIKDNWAQLNRQYGRRRGCEVEKVALDALSYECRAAFHRCYSALWCKLIPYLAENYGLTNESLNFLRLWHLEALDPGHIYRLFHGNVIGLHPAGTSLMTSPIARSVLGEWLLDPASDERFGRILNAILLAIHHYSEQRTEKNSGRRFGTRLMSSRHY